MRSSVPSLAAGHWYSGAGVGAMRQFFELLRQLAQEPSWPGRAGASRGKALGLLEFGTRLTQPLVAGHPARPVMAAMAAVAVPRFAQVAAVGASLFVRRLAAAICSRSAPFVNIRCVVYAGSLVGAIMDFRWWHCR